MKIFKRGDTVWYQYYGAVGYGEFIGYDRGLPTKASFTPRNPKDLGPDWHRIDPKSLFETEEDLIKHMVRCEHKSTNSNT